MLAEWIFGDDADGNQYVQHTRPPEFVGRLAPEEDSSISGITFALAEDEVLCDIRWYDPPPANLTALQAKIQAALDAYDGHS